MVSKFKEFFKDIIYVSKLTGTKNKKIRIALSVFFLFAAFGSDLIIIVTIASLFQSEIGNSNFIVTFLLDNLYLLPVVVVARFIFSYLDVLNSFKLKFDVEQNLRIYLLKEVFNKGNYSTGDAFHFMNSFALSVGAFYQSLTGFISSMIQLSLYALYLIYTDFQTLFILIVGACILYLPTKLFTLKGRTYAHIDWEQGREYNAQLQKVLENIFLIKLLKTVSMEVTKFRDVLVEFYKAHLNSQKVGLLTTSFPQFATLLLLSTMLAFFNYAKVFTLDFIGILIRLFQEFSKVNKNIMLVSNNHVVIKKLYELTSNQTNEYKANFIIANNNEYALTLKNISFKYFNADEYIFENLNLDISKYTHNVITGPNGSGKSTLLGLSSGLLYPQKGESISYSNKFGYVGVTPLIIPGTLKENLLYGNTKIIEDHVLLDYIYKFGLFNEEKNLDLNKTVSNKTLSSGQLQKISFIRSLLGEAEILLLDESTSNLDIDSKNLIFDILSESSLTILNCTHNPDDFKNVDNHIEIKIKDEKRSIFLN